MSIDEDYSIEEVLIFEDETLTEEEMKNALRYFYQEGICQWIYLSWEGHKECADSQYGFYLPALMGRDECHRRNHRSRAPGTNRTSGDRGTETTGKIKLIMKHGCRCSVPLLGGTYCSSYFIPCY